MKKALHKADTRGKVDFGWLRSYHTFSFGHYHNPDRLNFGVLRVLNDDEVSEGKGFEAHPHRNMEIISIALEGELKHKDNMGNETLIKEGDIQVMSAGTGVVHSEYNANETKKVKFLQIWIIPNQKEVTPRYDQISLRLDEKKNGLQQVLSPYPEDSGVWIHQKVWFHMGNLDKGLSINHPLKSPKTHGVYLFVIEGTVAANGETLCKRDGMGIDGIEALEIQTIDRSKILIMEVPMSF